MTPFQFLLISLAVWRAVRLWRFDTITTGMRLRTLGDIDGDGDGRPGWLLEHASRPTLWLLELLLCPWCLSIHVAFWALLGASVAGWVDISLSWAGATEFVASWFAVALASTWAMLVEGILSGLDERIDPEDPD